MALNYFSLPGIKVQPKVLIRHWHLVRFVYPDKASVIIIVGAEDNFDRTARKSTPVVSVEKHDGSDFEWLATTESGRKYVLPRKGEGTQNRDMSQMMCDLDDSAERYSIELSIIKMSEYLSYENH